MSGFFDRLKSMVIEETPVAPVVKEEPVVSAAPPVFMPSMTVQPKPELVNVIFQNINTTVNAVESNNLKNLIEMAETMKSAILDEGTRFKAAAAALKITFADVNGTVNTLCLALEAEKNKFINSEIAERDKVIADNCSMLDVIKKDIEATIAKLNELTASRDSSAQAIAQQKAERDQTFAIFEASANKVLADLQNERNKIQVYLPQGV